MEERWEGSEERRVKGPADTWEAVLTAPALEKRQDSMLDSSLSYVIYYVVTSL